MQHSMGGLDKVERMCKEVFVAQFEVLSETLPGETERVIESCQ